MKSCFKKQRLATKKKHIKQIRYKKRVFKQSNVDITPFNGLTSQQISTGIKEAFRVLGNALQKALLSLTELTENSKTSEVEE